MKLDREKLRRLLDLVVVTHDEELDCDEFPAQVAGYIERFDPHEPLPKGYAALHHHLVVCPECLEEFETLLATYRCEE